MEAGGGALDWSFLLDDLGTHSPCGLPYPMNFFRLKTRASTPPFAFQLLHPNPGRAPIFAPSSYPDPTPHPHCAIACRSCYTCFCTKDGSAHSLVLLKTAPT